ncbi:MAG: hypothetical protein ACOCWX_03510 [Spirochaetota bacterium]
MHVRGHRSRTLPTVMIAAVVLCAVSTPVRALDRFLRVVAIAEAVAPAALLVTQGVDTPLEAGVLGGAVALHTLPNIVLLLAESNDDARLTRAMRFVSSGAGFTSAAGSLGMGIALELGAFPDASWASNAGLFAATAVPALFAGLVDLVPYSLETARADRTGVASQGFTTARESGIFSSNRPLRPALPR